MSNQEEIFHEYQLDQRITESDKKGVKNGSFLKIIKTVR